MKVAFCANPEQPAALEQQESCIAWLTERSVHAFAIDTNELRFDTKGLDSEVARAAGVDLVCALGGDGTMLRATRLALGVGAPLLGINFGHLGYLTGAKAKSTLSALKAFMSGSLHAEQRVLLQAQVNYADATSATYLALNEMVLSRSDLGRVISVDISVNGHPLPTPRGDGLIVATATGSTAYALSAGGPLLTPSNQGLCLVPISAQGFNAAALVSAPSDIITLRPRAHTAQHALVCVDGQVLDKPAQVAVYSVVVEKAAQELTLLRYNAPDFFTRIGHSLTGGSYAH